MIEVQPFILIVDDDLAVRESLSFSLMLDGLEVQACQDGADLVTHPDLSRADCLVLDHHMPEMDGFQLLAKVRARGCRHPAILLTSHMTDALQRRAAMAGFHQVIEKPIQGSGLLECIHDVLRLAQPT